MAGSKNGFVKMTMVGCRVGTTEKNPMRYTPAHRKADGSLTSARLEVPVFVNEYGQKEPDAYKLIAWGGRADMFAKSLSKGKEMNFFLTSKSYFRSVYNNANQIVMQPDGVSPITVRQISFTIRDFTWGADSEAQVASEIAAQIRKPGWNDPNSPAHAEWLGRLQSRKTLYYNGETTYGYAVVRPVPQGSTVLMGDQSAIGIRRAAAAAGNVPATPALVAAVAQTLDPATGFPIASPAAAGAVAGV